MTPLLYIKLLRDLRAIWDRLVLMIFALGITQVMFSAILYTWSITSREMPRAYLGTNPASATLVFDRRLEADEMAAIAAEAHQQPGVIEATARTQLLLQVQQEGGGWGPNPLQIFVAAPDDPMQIESFTVEQGTWPPAPGEILISRSSFDLLNLEVGQQVVVQALGGEPVSLRVSGVVYIPALAPSFQEQKGHGFISADSLPLLGMPAAFDALKIQVADQPGLTTPSRSREVIVAATLDLADRLKQTYGVSIREIQIPEPYAHPHQAQLDSVLLGLMVFGAAGLLLSAILVATLLNGLFTQQIPQIGMMKAVGARSSRVLAFYLWMTVVIAAASTVLAMIPGILIGRAFAPVLLTLMGIDTQSLAVAWWTYGVVVAAGLGVPLLFSLISIVKTSRTTVREALDYRGVTQAGVSSARFGAWLGRLPGLDRTALMAFRNIFRRRARLLLSVGLLASAGAMFVGGMSTMAGFQASLDRQESLRRWDVEVRVAASHPVPQDTLANVLADVPGVTRVEGWSTLQTSIIPPDQSFSVTRTWPDQGHGSITVTVVPPESALITPPALVEGRWLRQGETNAVALSQQVLADNAPGIRSGDTVQLSLGGRFIRWQVVGITEPGGGHGGGIFITQAGFEAATGVSQPNLLRIVTDKHDEETRTAVAQAAERRLTEAGFVVRSAESVSRSAAAGAGHMLPLIVVFSGLIIGVSVVGFAGLTSTMSTSVLERTREFGVMSAIGARASRVRRLVVFEGIFIALISGLIAVIAAPLVTLIMVNYLPMTGLFLISVPGVVIWGVVAVAGAALATLAPASRAARLTIREALAYL